MPEVNIDLVAEDAEGRFILVAVEEGPWPIDSAGVLRELKRLQQKLYGYVDAAIDGALADAYPDSHGTPVVVRLNCYDLPTEAVESFFWKFADFIRSSSAHRLAMREKGYVEDIAFEFTHNSLNENGG